MGSTSDVFTTKIQSSLSAPQLLVPQSLSPRGESLSSKVKKILSSSPKVSKGKNLSNTSKIFGVPLECIQARDQADVPFIVQRLCEYIKTNGLNQEGLFRVNGNMKVVERLKVAFDKFGDAELEEVGDIAAAASLLKMFLRELSDPVIPEELQPLFIQVQEEHGTDKTRAAALIKELITRMPIGHATLLKYLTEFMLYIAETSLVNKMTPLALAIVFGPNIFRCKEGLEGLREQAFVNAVLLLILQQHREIFLTDNVMFPDSIKSEKPNKPIPYLEHMKAKHEKLNKQDKLITVSKPNNQDTKKQNSVIQSEKTNKKFDEKKIPVSISVKENNDQPVRCSSPYLNSSSSPLSQQLVAKTITTTVKEHLFGLGNMMSSTESEIVDDQVQSNSSANDVYPSVKERMQTFSKNKNQLTRSLSSPNHMGKQPLSDEDLLYIAERTSSPLAALTTSRAPPPHNRRRKSRSGSISQLMTKGIDGVGEDNRKQEGNISSDEAIEYPVPQLDIYRLSYEGEPQNSSHGQYDQYSGLTRSSPSNSPNRRDHRHAWVERRQNSSMEIADLKKRIHGLKKIITNFEENFEELEGRKPSSSEKQPMQKYITELVRAKKQLKELTEESRGTPPDILLDASLVQRDFNGTPLNFRGIPDNEDEYTKEDTLVLLLNRLEQKRLAAGRPHDLQAMTAEQLKEEKLSVQKALLQYENKHGRPETKAEKGLMRPLYDRYRKIKRRLATERADTPSKNSGVSNTYSNHTNVSRGSHYSRYSNNSSNFSNTSNYSDSTNPESPLLRLKTRTPKKKSTPPANKEYSRNIPTNYNLDVEETLGDTFFITNRLSPEPMSPSNELAVDDAVLHDATLVELLEQQKSTKRLKKRLGKLLKEFEDSFFITQQRKVQKDDRLPRESEYREYKLVKSKLRLIEALISKKAANQCS